MVEAANIMMKVCDKTWKVRDILYKVENKIKKLTSILGIPAKNGPRQGRKLIQKGECLGF
ncbi:hypothetical protein BIV60_20585 [Bacillus sp. MUM 116]|uniref:hypothetical protein n=1 Tax=Bacillus sp. MUM 116 TaxID=1678002 RepID=UPI0008F55AA9|nr:hypothetical protein [Bacillus sp. MUM 116]OIK10619.1 hypothetical protein BIV60_20585 [Bacillus sp. MUM 116]